MESHTTTGYRLLEGSQSDILQLAAEIALSHHERWDGQGYPHRISGPAIPIEARIVTVCDVYDALTNDRVYRNAFTHEEALTLMHAERGTRFEPTLLDLFLTTGPAQEPKLTTSTSRRSRAGGVAGGERSEVALALLASIASGG